MGAVVKLASSKSKLKQGQIYLMYNFYLQGYQILIAAKAKRKVD